MKSGRGNKKNEVSEQEQEAMMLGTPVQTVESELAGYIYFTHNP